MSIIRDLKQNLWNILNNRKNTVSVRFVRPIVFILATLNIASVLLYSYDPIITVDHIVTYLSYYSGVLFTIEYILRIWVSNLDPNKKAKKWRRVKYIFSFFGGVDFIAILPLFIPLLLTQEHIAVELINFTRVFLILKVIRYSRSFKLLSDVLQSARQELTMVLSIAVVIITFASMLMYYIERGAQPETFSSIGQGFWWAVITVTTVGYGDIYPITALGKILGAVIAIISIAMLAMPTAIISSTLTAKIQSNKNKITPPPAKSDLKCPHCGEVIHNSDNSSDKTKK